MGVRTLLEAVSDALTGRKEKAAFDAAQRLLTEAEHVAKGCLAKQQIAHARRTGIEHAPSEVQAHYESCEVCQERFKQAATE